MSHDLRAVHGNGKEPVMNQVVAETPVTTVADELRQPRSRRPAILANVYLEGTYSGVYPDKSEDAQGMCKFIKQFSFPGALAVTAPRRRLVPSTKTANWVIAPYS